MLFDTPIYFLFLILVVAVYWRLSFHKQNYFLLAFSYFFYGWWDFRFLILIGVSTVINYFVSHQIRPESSQHLGSDQKSREMSRRNLFFAALLLNLSFLGFFKYFGFFIDSFADLMSLWGMSVSHKWLQILLPPGISFYTFQEVAYLIDVYRGELKPAKNLSSYALFVCVFPHLIAGPIQRPGHLLPQLQEPRRWDPEKFLTA